MAYKILKKLRYSVATHFLQWVFFWQITTTRFNHLSLRTSFGSNSSHNYAIAFKGWLRMSFFIPLLCKIISSLDQLTINSRSKSIENKFWNQINVVKMTDESLSDCTNSACAIGLMMIIFHSPLQIFWPSFAFCGIKNGSGLFTAGSTQYVTVGARSVVFSTPWQVFVRTRVLTNKSTDGTIQ